MPAENNDLTFLALVERIDKLLQEKRDFADEEDLLSFHERSENVLQNLLDAKKEGRDLCIGIVGTVKAGKSTLLNALFFEGKDILPKAATPMTAALTKLTYSEEACAEIYYYTQDEWKNITVQAENFQALVDRRYAEDHERWEKANQKTRRIGLPARTGAAAPREPQREDAEQQVRATPNGAKLHGCVELVELARKNQLDLGSLLGQTVTLRPEGASLPEFLHNSLGQYVGAEGRYTPIVKYIELALPVEGLKNFVIVDTPGLNDPVVSRSQQTNKFLVSCDTVLLASNVTQFLTQQDVTLLNGRFKDASVARVHVIGTKLDLGILQSRARTLSDAHYSSCNVYKGQFDRVLQELRRTGDARSLESAPGDRPPHFVSAIVSSIGQKKSSGDELNKEETQVFATFRSRFSDVDEVFSNLQDYADFAGIDDVRRDVFDVERRLKDETIRQRIAKLTYEQAAGLISGLEQVTNSVRRTRDRLQNTDLAKLRDDYEKMRRGLDKARRDVSHLFENQAAKCRRSIEEIKIEIGKETSRHTELDVREETKERTREMRSGFLGLMRRTEAYTVRTNVAEPSQAVENVRSFGTEAQGIINDRLRDMIDLDGFKKSVIDCVMKAFDQDDEFDPEEVTRPLETLLSRLTLHTVNYDFLPMAEDAIFSAFSGLGSGAKGEDIHRLYALQEQQIGRVLQKLSAAMDKLGQQLTHTLTQQAGTFVDDVMQRLHSGLQKNERLLADKEQNLKDSEALIGQLTQLKGELRPYAQSPEGT